MTCDDIQRALADFSLCEQTPDGARIATHCLYPSFESVRIFVAQIGDGYDVHDGMGAYNTAWLHGRDEAMIMNSIRRAVDRFCLSLRGRTIVAKAPSVDWLSSAIISVANASSLAAHEAVAKLVAAAEEALVNRIDGDLKETFGPRNYAANVEVRGASGGMRHFDFIVRKHRKDAIYINGVLPHANSIASKYVSFADTDVEKNFKFAVHDKPLDNDDALLLQQVSLVVPLPSLRGGVQRVLL